MEPITYEPFVAVDIGTYSLKFVHIFLDSNNKPVLKTIANLRIPPFVHLLTPEEREKMSREDVENDALMKLRKFLTKHLTELLYDNQIQTKRGFTLASGRAVTVRYFELPPLPEKDAFAASVRAEATKQMPFSMEKAVFAWQDLGEIFKDEKPLKQIVVAALQEEFVKITQENLKGGGMTTDGILILPQAIELALGEAIIKNNNAGKIAIIHCGHKTTSVMIYKNGVLNFYRDIPMGGETITDALYAGGELNGEKYTFKSYDEATDLKHKIGVLPPDEIQSLKGVEKWAAQQIFSTVEKIFQHIQLSISFYISQSSESSIDKVILTGGTSAMKNFKEFIQESLEVPTEIGNPFLDISPENTNFPPDRLKIEAPALIPAIGIAKYNQTIHSKVINFIDILYPDRKSISNISIRSVGTKFSFNLTKLDETKLRIITVCLLGIIVLLGLYPLIRIKREISRVKKDCERLSVRLESLKNEQSEVTNLLQQKELLSKQIDFAEFVKNYKLPVAQLLLDLASATPETIYLQEAVISLSAEDKKFRLVGHADSTDKVFEYMKLINLSTFFKNSNLENTEEVQIDDEQYFIKFALGGRIVIPETKPSERAN